MLKPLVDKAEYELYGWNTPNAQKIIIALEETGATYRYHPINIRSGEQNTAQFRALSPDGKIPALVVNSTPPVSYFESGAILLYLASVYPVLNGTEEDKSRVLSWTLWQVGQLGPIAGQFGRFSGAASSNAEAIEHFEKLLWRCLEVLDKRLCESSYLAGDSFTVADIAVLPWIASNQSYLQIYNFPWQSRCPALVRWTKSLYKRPSVVKALSSDDWLNNTFPRHHV